jgi:hypothetical protein
MHKEVTCIEKSLEEHNIDYNNCSENYQTEKGIHEAGTVFLLNRS